MNDFGTHSLTMRSISGRGSTPRSGSGSTSAASCAAVAVGPTAGCSASDATWARARGWVLYQALGALSYYTPETNAVLFAEGHRWLSELGLAVVRPA